tara:strand:+ start:2562 stop:2801 length:240 start_codon:yes stop_codon:yes gene_type:complete
MTEDINGWSHPGNWEAWVLISNDPDLYRAMVKHFKAGGSASWEAVRAALPAEEVSDLDVEEKELSAFLESVRGGVCVEG